MFYKLIRKKPDQWLASNILNGTKTKDCWDATIKADSKPLRMKIRNIYGDETVWLIS